MVGLPATLATRQDWLHAHEYVRQKNNPALKEEFRLRLAALNETRGMKILKQGVDKPAEEQTPEDYEDALDPLSPFATSGLSEDEIARMTGELQ